jgi:hypothetical protein
MDLLLLLLLKVLLRRHLDIKWLLVLAVQLWRCSNPITLIRVWICLVAVAWLAGQGLPIYCALLSTVTTYHLGLHNTWRWHGCQHVPAATPHQEPIRILRTACQVVRQALLAAAQKPPRSSDTSFSCLRRTAAPPGWVTSTCVQGQEMQI